jgi:hypothetical protein
MAVAEGTVEERLEEMFRRCLVRPPGAEEKRLLGAFFREQRARFERGELDAEKVAGTGEGDAAERAAWTAVARAVMNLDEMITKG